MSGFVSVVFVYKSFLNMVASLSICTLLEQRFAIRFLVVSRRKASEISH